MNSSATGPILVGVDGSASSVAALRKADELAQALGADLEVITCWEIPQFYSGELDVHRDEFEKDAESRLHAAVHDAFGERVPSNLRTEVQEGRTAQQLIRHSDHAQLLVLGTRGRNELVSLILGAVSLECVAHAHCPVLTVHAAKSR